MKTRYGHEDESGEYFIFIDAAACTECGECVAACPEGVLEMIIDEYEDEVSAVVASHRDRLKESCAPCKPPGASPALPCIQACPEDAIHHSW